jgi:tRNA(fMet)-specific endonuclease VapC
MAGMKRYMLDTNIVSHAVKGHIAVSAQMMARPIASLCVSSITEGELLYGLAKRPAATRLHTSVHELLQRLDVLAWDRHAAARYGVVRADMENRGQNLADLDLLIAAHALDTDAVLVTNDRAFHYVDGLTIEDWTE